VYVCLCVCVPPFEVLNPTTDFYETQYVRYSVAHPNSTHHNFVLSATTWWKRHLLSGPSITYPYGNRKIIQRKIRPRKFPLPPFHSSYKSSHTVKAKESTSEPVKKIRIYHKQLNHYHKIGKLRLQKQIRAKARKTKKKL
jgi:hypothetical protein